MLYAPIAFVIYSEGFRRSAFDVSEIRVFFKLGLATCNQVTSICV